MTELVDLRYPQLLAAALCCGLALANAARVGPVVVGALVGGVLVAAPRPVALAVGDPRGEVDELELRLARRAAGPPDRLGHARAVAQPVQARPANGSHHVHVDLRGCGGSRVRGDPHRRRHGRVPRTEQGPSGEREHEHHDRRACEHTTPVEQGFWHVANRDNETVTCL